MQTNLEYYKIFYYVAKYGNISQAAKLLLNNQPNLTRAIKNLEGELGCPLFSRTNRGMKLTPEGEQLYSHIKVAFGHIKAGEDELMKAKSLQSGTIFIAASEVSLRCLLLPVIRRYRKLYPGVHIQISNHSTPQAIAALKDGTAELAVVTTPTVRSASLIERSIIKIREVAICSPAFEQLIGKTVSLSEIQSVPLISLGSDTKSYEFYSNFFASHSLTFRPDIEVCTADQIVPMVEADLGVGFVACEFIHPTDNVCILDIAEEIPTRDICLIKRKEQPLSVAAKELEKMILEATQDK